MASDKHVISDQHVISSTQKDLANSAKTNKQTNKQTNNQTNKTGEPCLISKKTLKPYKTNLFDSTLDKIMTTGVKACSKIIFGLLPDLEQGNKMF